MKNTDYAGLSHFRDYCKDFDKDYVVVGGFATVMLLDEGLGKEHGKATHDIDLVLLTNNSPKLSQKIKEYISEGQYTIQIGEKNQYKYYRFTKPKIENFAKEIELFASNENNLELEDNQRIIPIDAEDGLYSLSAIMLDNEYFEMIKNNIDKIQDVPITNTQATIMLKMSAFYDLKQRNDKKWKKHRRDIVKLTLLLDGSEKIYLKGRMINDFNSFIEHLEKQLDSKALKSFADGLPLNKGDILEMLRQVFTNEIN